jgi:hypothetical protein
MIRHHPAARSTGLLKEVFAASLGPEAIMIAPGCRRTRVSRDLEQMNLPIIPFQVSRSRGGRCACRQSGVFLCAEPSFLEHNGGIVTCCFSQRYRSQAVVKRSNSKSTIEFP